MLVVPAADVVAFLHPLPVGALWGVGEKTEQALTRLGLRTVGDIAHTPRSTLVRALGQATGSHLHALSWGRDERTVVPHEPDKSIGAEETFARDVDDPEVVRRELLRLSEKTAARLRVGRAWPAGRSASRCGSPTSRRSPGPGPCPRPPTWPPSSTPPPAALYEALGLDRARLRLVGVRVEGLIDVRDGAPPAAAGRAQPGSPRGRAGRRPGGPAVRLRRGTPGQPGPGADGTDRPPRRRLTGATGKQPSRPPGRSPG